MSEQGCYRLDERISFRAALEEIEALDTTGQLRDFGAALARIKEANMHDKTHWTQRWTITEVARLWRQQVREIGEAERTTSRVQGARGGVERG